jgi:Mor family transcriptional regulator
MSQALDQLAALRTTVTRIVRETTGLHERLAVPVAAAICTEIQTAYGGAALYVPAITKRERNRAILADWHAGRAIPDICQRHRVGRTTVYRLIGQRPPACPSRA